MADDKSPKKEPVVKAAPKLARASETGDAAVHNLLAERIVHESNGDKDKVADVDRRLADLGYTV